MDVRVRAAPKRPLPVCVDEGGDSSLFEASQGDVWQSSPSASGGNESRESINTCVQVVDTATNTFAIKVTRCQLEHNHRLNVQSFKSHPSNRVVLEEESMQTSILHFIKDNSESNPTSQDVRNLVRKLKERDARDGPSTAEKRLKKWMKQFGDTPGKGGRIFVDDINQ
ncbi:hypothetical protein L915_10764 [Phytophthora nicotianae]|uniref:MULE transposase domain-containing protein n=1 Tax=Phytophthora nicotianae TaxID=4792 RepID=W2GN04_PHYNI|nr:hypothetical protein L915_10764 [Phytophthora nicotianae]